MCIFNTPVVEVAGTKIFTTFIKQKEEGHKQLVVYSNYVSLEEYPKKGTGKPTPAMILPVPEGDISFVDLSYYRKFFTELNSCFPVVKVEQYRSRGRSRSCKPLEVVQVGSYSCSIAPTLQDLRRIDTNVFSVHPDVEKLLSKHYASSFSFIIATFRDNKKKHPFAYVHVPLSSTELFIPTRHYHGESEETRSAWDHEIYSLDCGNNGEAGLSVEETRQILDSTGKDHETNMNLKSVRFPETIKFDRSGTLRLLRKKGVLKNCDIILSLSSSDNPKPLRKRIRVDNFTIFIIIIIFLYIFVNLRQ